VIDGDTIEARVAIWPGLVATETVRLLGVDRLRPITLTSDAVQQRSATIRRPRPMVGSA
jgi:hypothetical protein